MLFQSLKSSVFPVKLSFYEPTSWRTEVVSIFDLCLWLRYNLNQRGGEQSANVIRRTNIGNLAADGDCWHACRCSWRTPSNYWGTEQAHCRVERNHRAKGRWDRRTEAPIGNEFRKQLKAALIRRIREKACSKKSSREIGQEIRWAKGPWREKPCPGQAWPGY